MMADSKESVAKCELAIIKTSIILDILKQVSGNPEQCQ